MGISNYAILNALRKKEEMMALAQQGQEVAAADHDDAEQVAQGEQEVELQPPPLSGSDTANWWHSKQHTQ